jgi:hypothetical protein
VQLRIHAGGAVLQFVAPNTAAASAPNARDWLMRVSGLNLGARGGAFSLPAEASSVIVDLDNRNRQAADLIGRPLRALAELYADDGETLQFAGLVQALEYGSSLAITIEA